MRYADLHMHSTHSDGSDTPEKLVLKAAKAGISLVSITDHDTCSGYEEAQKTGSDADVEIMTGIEVSTYVGERSIHILGYMIDINSDSIKKIVSLNKEGRLERMERVISKLNRLGYKVDLDGVVRFTGPGVLGRALLAKYLVSLGYFGSVNDVFSSILGDGKPAYEPIPVFSPADAIELIRQAGGVSSLAHPGCYWQEIEINELIEAGLDGIEVYSVHHGPEEESKYLDVARRNDLLLTGGSDCHGSTQRGGDVGCVKLPYNLVDDIKNRAAAVTISG